MKCYRLFIYLCLIAVLVCCKGMGRSTHFELNETRQSVQNKIKEFNYTHSYRSGTLCVSSLGSNIVKEEIIFFNNDSTVGAISFVLLSDTPKYLNLLVDSLESEYGRLEPNSFGILEKKIDKDKTIQIYGNGQPYGVVGGIFNHKFSEETTDIVMDYIFR